MSAQPPTRASDLAANQVEQIVSAAQEAAGQIQALAQREREDLRDRGEREVEQLREKAARDAQEELNAARKEAILLTEEARRDADKILSDAKEESGRLREQTEIAVQGRTASAEKAAADVLAEARTLSGGLTQLGRSLEGQAERILREVTAAHKRMQADLRIESGSSVAPAVAPPPEESRSDERPAQSGQSSGWRANPFEDLDIPSWER